MQMKMDEHGFKWMKMDEVDVSGKHRHRRNVTRYHFFDNYNFHQQATSNLPSLDNFHQSTTFIKRQLSSLDNFHQQTTFTNRQHSSIDNFHHFYGYYNFHQKTTPITGNFHQTTNFIERQFSFAPIDNFHPHSPEPNQSSLQKVSSSHQSSLQKLSSLTRVTSIKSLEDIFTRQGHSNQVNANVQSVSE